MQRWQRIKYQPNLPLYTCKERVTGSKKHIELSRQAAGEGMVLLKNDGDILPLRPGTRAALFGKASIDYVKGGGGSGDVTVSYVRNLYEGMKIKEQEGKVSLFPALEGFYREALEQQYKEGAVPGMTQEPEIPEALLKEAAAYADVAVISICRFSGEGWDRKALEDGTEPPLYENEQIQLSNRLFENGDFYLSRAEQKMVEQVKEAFSRVVVVLNVGGMVDTTWFQKDSRISAALMAWQAGMEGGLAEADILCGDVNPSGKLADTFASSLYDYPSTKNFHESPSYVDYTEDIYVGYRYFETIAGAKEKVNYPFGFGLSYTEFRMEIAECNFEEKETVVFVKVTNIGERAGKEVVQVYYSAPQGLLGKPARELAAFQKTRLLGRGESQMLRLTIPYSRMASYDDCGKICKSAYVLEKGRYRIYVGNCVAQVQEAGIWNLSEDRIVEQLSPKAGPCSLRKRLLSDGSYEELPLCSLPEEEPGLQRQDPTTLEGITPESRYVERGCPSGKKKISLADVAEGKAGIEELLAQMSGEEVISLIGGQPNTGVANTFGMGNLPGYGIPNVMTADGPAGLRINPECGVTTTAWPCATLLASTWDTELAERIGQAGAEEVKENNLGIWLTPAMNIHRSPLCGRNFEYYSEDPLLTGKIGAAMVRGIQSMRIGASVKHFACKNKETNRKASDSRVSERALREIYLKGFEIVVKEADPYTIMSSYNLLNGVHTSENKDLLTGILREEWGFDGVVTTDWWTLGEHYRETKAGNDIKMGNGYPERVLEALEKGYITREEIELCAGRILRMILKLD